MSIKLLQDPEIRYSENMERTVYAVKEDGRQYYEGGEVREDRAFAQVTVAPDHENYIFGPQPAKVLRISGVVDHHYYYRETVSSRTAFGLLPLPFLELRGKYAEKRSAKKAVLSALNKYLGDQTDAETNLSESSHEDQNRTRARLFGRFLLAPKSLARPLSNLRHSDRQ